MPVDALGCFKSGAALKWIAINSQKKKIEFVIIENVFQKCSRVYKLHWDVAALSPIVAAETAGCVIVDGFDIQPANGAGTAVGWKGCI